MMIKADTPKLLRDAVRLRIKDRRWRRHDRPPYADLCGKMLGLWLELNPAEAEDAPA